MSGGLIGRDREASRLRARLTDLLEGRGGTVAIRGDAGVGKTALLRQLMHEAEQLGVVTLRATGMEGGEAFPMRAADLLLDDVRASLSETASASELTRGAIGGHADSGTHPGHSTHRRELVRLIAKQARTAPVLVCFDDAHWFDAASCEVFGTLSAALLGEPVLLVAAMRPPSTAGSGGASLATLAEEVFEIGGISAEDAGILLAQDGPIAADVARACWRIADGNPLALRSIVLEQAQRLGNKPIDAMVLRPVARLDGTFGDAFGALGDGARRFVGVLAISTLSGPVAVSAAAATADDLNEAVASLLINDETSTFRHPLMRPAILERIGADERRSLHALVSRALDADPYANELRAWHLAASIDGFDADAAEDLAKTAAAARSRGAVREALQLLERAAALHPDAERQAELLVDAASAAWFRAELARAEHLLDSAEQTKRTSPGVIAKSAEVRAHIRMWTDGPMAALPILDSAVERIESDLPDIAISLLAVAAVFAQILPDGHRATEYAEHAERLAVDASGFGAIGAQFAVAASATGVGDAARAAAAFERLEPLIAVLADRAQPEFEHILGAYAVLNTQREFWHEARTLLERLLIRSERMGAVAQTGLFSVSLGMVEWFTGDWLRALTLTRLGDQRSILPVASAMGLAQLAVIEASLGLVEDAQVSIERTRALGLPRQAGAAIAIAGWAQGLLLLGSGDFEAAIVPLRTSLGTADRAGMHDAMSAWWWADLIESLWMANRADEAATELEHFKATAARSRRPSAAGMVARLDAVLSNDPAFAIRRFGHAELFEQTAGVPFARARTVLARAIWRQRNGDADGSRIDAANARSRFERLGALLFTERAASLLDPLTRPTGAVSLLVPVRAEATAAVRRKSSLLDRLSPAELRVVEVIVRGVTIRQAAEQLLLSSKTVDAHLQRVYQKLGIRSRAELAGLFERANPSGLVT